MLSAALKYSSRRSSSNKEDGGGLDLQQGNHPLHGKPQQKIEVMDGTQELADLIERQQLADLTLRWKIRQRPMLDR